MELLGDGYMIEVLLFVGEGAGVGVGETVGSISGFGEIERDRPENVDGEGG